MFLKILSLGRNIVKRTKLNEDISVLPPNQVNKIFMMIKLKILKTRTIKCQKGFTKKRDCI